MRLLTNQPVSVPGISQTAKFMSLTVGAGVLVLVLSGCGVSRSNTRLENVQALEADAWRVLAGASILAGALADTPLPADIAATDTGKAISYWSRYAAAIAPALAKAASLIPGQEEAAANPPQAQ